ncbi:SecDF P1 head subdomain-containing protein [Nocardioides humi]|uniref:SecDF P1 head subdomain domain-containing protein n=1 Tax=Nocardioides humi TaxID=449461 RepID=A0ABN1ZSM4_9ACTN|nr:hypothetical protein [Nocardioides humi]
MAPSRALGAITLATALTLALAACGDGDDADARDDGNGGPVAEPTSPAGTPAEPVQFRRVLESTASPAATPAPTPLPADCGGLPAEQPEPTAEAIACDGEGMVYRLGPAEIVGGVDDAEVGAGPSGGWTVMLELDDEATAAFADLTAELVGTGQQLAVLSGGTVISAPIIQTAITEGKVQIAGDFDQDAAQELADALEGD